MLLWSTQSVWAQNVPSKISFQRILDNSDVAVGAIEAIVQDPQGYIWIGGENGLLRYDGYELRLMGQQDNTGEKVKNIFYMFVDSRGILWISSSTGLLRYYPDTESFVLYSNRDDTNMKLSNVHVKHMAELANGELVLATVTGLTIINVETESTRFFPNEPGSKNALQSEDLWAVAIDKNDNVWLGSDKGVDMIHWATGEVVHYNSKDDGDKVITPGNVQSIAIGRHGDIWVATLQGLSRISSTTGDVIQYRHDPDNPNSLSTNEIRRIFEDSRGIVWVGTDQGGLNYFDPELNQFGSFRSVGGITDSLNSNVVRSIYEDRNGDLWVGNFPTGVNYFDRSTSATTVFSANASDPHSLSYNSVLDFSPDKHGNYWLATDGGGLDYFNRKTNRFTHYVHHPKDPHSISANAVLTTLLDSDGVLWAGTWGAGFNRFDEKTGTFIRYNDVGEAKPGITQSKRLNSPNVRLIQEDKLGNLWLGTQYGALNKYDRKTGVYTHYMPDPADPSAILYSIIYSLLEDSQGRFWVGTENSLELMDRAQGTFTHFQHIDNDPTSLSNNSILSMYEDSKGRLWFGTYDGVNLLQPDNKTFRSYRKIDGLHDPVIRSIIEGPDGQLWMGTSNGISSLNPETGEIKNFYKNNGWLTGDFNPGAAYRSPNDELFFGGINGFTILNLAELKTNTTIPPLAFTDFKLFTDSVKINAEDGLLNKAIDRADSITLNYQQSMFSFTFAALNFRDSVKNEYAYKLDGFDQDWRNVGTQRQATYTNIDPGDYVFRVKGSNNDGVWNELGTSIKIIQLPPPWKTWWAYSLYALMVLAALAWFVESQRAKRRRVEEQNRILESRVAERTAQLQKKNHDIEGMLSNMQQGLFTIVGDGVIDPEYSAFLESIFETNRIAGENAADFLFSSSTLGVDTVGQNRAAIDALVGADPMMFDFNRHVLVKEHEVNIGRQIKVLALDWSPIVINNEINKLMVTVRDVTELKALEAEASGQKRELDIVGQLLNVASKKFRDFEKSSREFLRENRQLITASVNHNSKTIEELFRNMHTIKGNSRTYGFTYLTDLVHGVETTYSHFRQNPDEPWHTASLIKDLDTVESILDEYARVYYNLLHRGDESGSKSRGDGFWMEDKVIDSIKSSFGTPKLEPQLSRIFDHAQSAPLPDVLENIVHSLAPMADEIGKANPNVKFFTDNLRIRKSAYELVGNVFMHLLRNSLDHGLETAEQRRQLGKSEQGEIIIRADVERDCVNLICTDDGRGLNLQRLYEKGIEYRHWVAGDQPDPLAIAQIIFESGISTKEQVSSISGRGVGMDAVATFLKEQGGAIHIHLLSPPTVENGRYPFTAFETIIRIPRALCVVES